jgi:hypothetical protein
MHERVDAGFNNGIGMGPGHARTSWNKRAGYGGMWVAWRARRRATCVGGVESSMFDCAFLSTLPFWKAPRPAAARTVTCRFRIASQHRTQRRQRPIEQTTPACHILLHPLPRPSGETVAIPPTQCVCCPSNCRALSAFAPSHDPP